MAKRAQHIVGALSAAANRADAMRDKLRELAEREREALKIIELLDQQRTFINLNARARVILGGNRSSKTFSAMIDLAMLVMGTHPTRQFPKGYHGRVFCVAREKVDLSEVYYQKLFAPGAFKMIRDPETKLWRSYRPNNPEDRARRDQCRQGPPLIPERCVKNERYYEKGNRIPKKFLIVNDLGQKWYISFFTGAGKPKRGVDVDRVHITEELDSPEWPKEMFMRLLDRKGDFVWDATAQDGDSDQLMRLIDKAVQTAGDPDAIVKMIQLSTRDNPFIDEEDINVASELLGSEEEIQTRIDGVPNMRTAKMFPGFSRKRLELKRETFENGHVPANWCRYVAVDPGWGTAAALFLAVPPPDHPLAGSLLLYDEVYRHNAVYSQFAEAFADTAGGHQLHAFICDMQKGRITEGIGLTVAEQLIEEFRIRDIRSRVTGNGFLPGCNNPAARANTIRRALEWQGTRPLIRILAGTCMNLCSEMERLRRDRKKTRNGWLYLDTAANHQDDHLVDCLGYLLCHDLFYHEPPNRIVSHNDRMDERFRQKMKLRGRLSGGPKVVLGPRSLGRQAQFV